MWIKATAVLPPWVTAVLVIAIAWQAAKIFWLLYPTSEPQTPVPMVQHESAATGDGQSAVDVAQSIINKHLFGKADVTQAPVEIEDPEDAPDTNLNLELRGTIAAQENEQAVAIIAEPSGSEKIYMIGDAIPGGVTLHAVYMDRVLLRRGPKLETLKLPRADQTKASQARPTNRRSARSQSSTSSLRDVISSNPARLTDVIRPQPVFRDGKQQGYRVYPGRQRQKFSQLGLRPGDMITQINGMALDDPARGMEVFRSLGDATQVSVTVMRNGQQQVMTLDTSQLQSPDKEAAGPGGSQE